MENQLEEVKIKSLIGKNMKTIKEQFNVSNAELLAFLSDKSLSLCDVCLEVAYSNEVRYEGYDFVIKNEEIAKKYDASCICDSCIADFDVDFI